MRPISGREMCRLQTASGWVYKRIGKAGERKIITVPVHGNKDHQPGLAAAIARDANLTW